MDSLTVKNLSPLNEYWQSSQNAKDNQKRLSLANEKSPASFLFINEPYKWEVLYQSSMNDILHGDLSAIPALRILLGTLQEKIRINFINRIRKHNFLDRKIIDYINNLTLDKPEITRPPLKKIIILCFIFTNPYEIDLKGDKRHIYETTGAICNKLRNIFNN